MPSLQTQALRSRRLRPASHGGVHGGASSMLRLAQPGAQRLPAGNLLTQWMQRASAALAPEMATVADDAPSAFITRLAPSADLGWR
jgi:hypothetical protein